MFDQTFSLIDLPRLITLIFLEGILSVDNAVAMAVIVRRLPVEQRRKALFIGLVSALFLRALTLLTLVYLIALFWIQFLGGMYLIFLSCKHLGLLSSLGTKKKKEKKSSFWMTVVMIELTDLIFALDSILAGLAFIGVAFHPPSLPAKLWIVYVGGVAGLILIRFISEFFSHLMERFEHLETGAYLIVGWVGLKIALAAGLKWRSTPPFPPLPSWVEVVFWVGVIGFLLLGFLPKKRRS